MAEFHRWFPAGGGLTSVSEAMRAQTPRMVLPDELRCIEHRYPIRTDQGATAITAAFSYLVCANGCHVPVIGGIPRFTGSDNYAAAFGSQWKKFRVTQLDSYTGTTISHDRLARCLGGSFDAVKGKHVLEAGCGAGRFTEQLLKAGAQVFACDLSNAVEANYENCGGGARYFVCQANILEVPVIPASFDVVLCIGVVQHTPNPEQTIAALCAYVKPGGLLVIDHYRDDASDMSPVRQRIRRFLLRRSPRFSLLFIRILVSLLWPVHKILWKYRARPRIARLYTSWSQRSPVVDYQSAYGQLGAKWLYTWAVLDTHDLLTDFYKHKRTVEEIADCLQKLGMTDARVTYGGNGVEARATKPMAQVVAGSEHDASKSSYGGSPELSGCVRSRIGFGLTPLF